MPKPDLTQIQNYKAELVQIQATIQRAQTARNLAEQAADQARQGAMNAAKAAYDAAVNAAVARSQVIQAELDSAEWSPAP